jgi:segregation and condensation protein A
MPPLICSAKLTKREDSFVSMNTNMTSITSTYKVNLPSYSGPLDLLLHLIERNELDITAISLAAVTEQYLTQISQLTDDRVEHLMDFLIIGARLLLIKSRALLPQIPSGLTDEEEEEDPAEALARQLRRYKQFKANAGWLANREEKGLRTYLRVAPLPQLEGELDLSGVTPGTLIAAFQAVLERADLLEDSVSIAAEARKITVDDKIRQLREAIKVNERIQFTALLSDRTTRVELSVTLLAVLELVKRHEVNMRQSFLFGPIEIVADIDR